MMQMKHNTATSSTPFGAGPANEDLGDDDFDAICNEVSQQLPSSAGFILGCVVRVKNENGLAFTHRKQKWRRVGLRVINANEGIAATHSLAFKTRSHSTMQN